MSRLRKGSRLHRLLYGQGNDDQGVYRVRRGTVEYVFADDQFRVVDLLGMVMLQTDLGEEVERWLIREGWVNIST